MSVVASPGKDNLISDPLSPPRKILKTANSYLNSRKEETQRTATAPKRRKTCAADSGEKNNGSSSPNISSLNINNQASNPSKMSKMDDNEIDESLYSRQLYVLGHDAMKRMQSSNVLISGLRALGVEIAKNVILGGVKSVTLHDPEKPNKYDLSAQYYLKESDLTSGKTREEISRPQLAELNTYVPLSSCDELSEENILKHQVVVLTNSSEAERFRVSEICHANGIKFISCHLSGLAGGVFCDFGENHIVYDSNGEACKSVMVAKIHKEDGKWLVTCLDEARHGFESGDHVEFKEVQGLTNIEGIKFEIQVKGPFNFEIKVPENVVIGGEYTTGGICSQVKVPISMKFKSMKDTWSEPPCMIADFAKFERPNELHGWFQALDKSGKTHASTEAEAKEIIKNSPVSLPEKVFIPLTMTAAGQLTAMAAVLGGIAAQEVMKSVSGKFTPLNQYCYFDAIECLGDDLKVPEDLCHDSGRYTGQTCVFGKKSQKKISESSVFCVGSGAIGCELLKTMGMMGIASDKQAQLIVTDMDTIEKSNLNRQFLFRSWDVGQMKGTVAAKAVKEMNPEVNIVAHENRVGKESENIYNDEFFNKLAFVTNALDNVDARLYMDRRCVYYKKPLFESGTLGTAGNVQVVLPDITESYGSSQDPPEKSIPICTLKNFPNAIEHTIQWARDQFEGLFRNNAEVVNQYLDNSDEFFARSKKLPGSEATNTLTQVKTTLTNDLSKDFKSCVCWARMEFERQYVHQIKQLLYNFPPDQVTSSGAKFWSGPKRCPRPAVFNLTNQTHFDYLVALSHLRAQMYNIDIPKESESEDFLASCLDEMEIKEFVPKQGVKIAANDSEAQQQAQQSTQMSTDMDEFENIKTTLPPVSDFGKWRMSPHDFEKDDDSNRHIDFIVACSNIRAWNYSIEEADRHTTKKVAGKIIPAIATTTALVVGMVGLEIYKYINGAKSIETYKNAFINLALPFLSFSEPIAPKKEKYYDVEWTLWDRFEVDGRKPDGSEMTLQELIDYFEEHHKFEIIMLSSGVSMIMSFFMNAKTKAERMKMPVSKAIEAVTKKPVLPHETCLVLEICANDADGEDLETPYINYRFR